MGIEIEMGSLTHAWSATGMRTWSDADADAAVEEA